MPFYVLVALFMCLVLNGNKALYIFNGNIIIQQNITAYLFTFEVDVRPIGDDVLFLLNDRTVDVLRIFNKTCYNKDGKCDSISCVCFCTDKTFRFRYIFNHRLLPGVTYIFGVETRYIDKAKDTVFKLTLSRHLNSTGFGPLKTKTVSIHNLPVKTTAESFNNNYNSNLTIIIVFGIAFPVIVLLLYALLISFNGAANMLKNVIPKIKDRIEVIEKQTDNLCSASQGFIMFHSAETVYILKQEILEFKDYLEVYERRHNEDNTDLTHYLYISKDGRWVTTKENEDYMYVLEKRLQMIYAAFRSLRNWYLDGVFQNLTEKIKEGLDIIRHEIQITLIKYGGFSCRTVLVEGFKKDINSIENNLDKISYACENFEVVKKAADAIYMIEWWIKATKYKIGCMEIYGFDVEELKEDAINIMKSKLKKIRYSCERIGYACKNAGVWKKVSVGVIMIQSRIEEMIHKIEYKGKRTLNGISADINIIESELEKILPASVGKTDADIFFEIQWQIGKIKDKIDVIEKRPLYSAYAIREIPWRIELIKDHIDVIGKSSSDENLRRKSEVGNSKHIRISGQGITPAVKVLGLILIMLLLSEVPRYRKKNPSFDGRLKIQKDICWSVDMSFMQFKNKQIWSAGQIDVHGKDENLQGNHMRMQPLVVKG